MELDGLEQTLLDVLRERGPDGWLNTQEASDLVLARLREIGGSFSLFTTAPWFGLSEAAGRLEDLGLIEIDPGMAEFVPPGAPTPTAEMLFLRVTLQGTQDDSEAPQA